MSKRSKLLEFLLKPPLALCIAMWAMGAVTLGGSLTLYFLGLGGETWAIAVHLVALLFFVLSIYAFLTVIGVPKRAFASKNVKKFLSSYDVRAFVYATCSVVFTCCYVAFGIIIAMRTHSPWLGALVGYHMFLLVARGITIYTSKIKSRADGADAKLQQIRAYSYCGLALCLLGFALLPVIRLTVLDRNSYNYFVDTIVYVTAIAAYTFVKFGIALRNLFKVKHSSDMSLKAIKNVSFSDALISLFALQAMMLKELGDKGLGNILNPVLGAVISTVIIARGLYMVVRGMKLRKGYANIVEDDGEGESDPKSDEETVDVNGEEEGQAAPDDDRTKI